MRGDFDVLEPVIGIGILIARVVVNDYDFRRDRIARRELAQRGGGLDLVGHRHGLHEALDHIAIDARRLRLRIDGNDAAGEWIALRGERL